VAGMEAFAASPSCRDRDQCSLAWFAQRSTRTFSPSISST
jgi:hypothetical protein